MSRQHDDIELSSAMLGSKNEDKSKEETVLITNSVLDEKEKAHDFEERLNVLPLNEDTTCGFWRFRGQFYQRFANQTAFFVLYSIAGCIFSMTSAYFNATISTLEKRYKIPSRNSGILIIGNNISEMLLAALLSYYAGKGHRPKWMGLGMILLVVYCFICATPHLLFGAGKDALTLTAEYGASLRPNDTKALIEKENSKLLCQHGENDVTCDANEGNLAAQVIIFTAQFISGIGGALYFSLGVAYMDDNTDKAKMPTFLSISTFIQMLGPAMGFALASYCLSIYIAPGLQPVIENTDPRWLGAWWLGWILLGILLLLFGLFVSMFPKELPRTRMRHILAKENSPETVLDEEDKASFKDMMETFKRLCKNKTLMYNNFSSIFFFFGFAPYWIYTPKYIEIQYRQSAATSSLATGTWPLGASAAGVLISGVIISKFKPRARYLAAWNVIVGFLTVIGIISYAFIGCPDNEESIVIKDDSLSALSGASSCNSDCYCDYVRYSPVCGENNLTFISPCHAGCRKYGINEAGNKFYFDCSCISPSNRSNQLTSGNTNHKAMELLSDIKNKFSRSLGGQAMSGACAVDCYKHLIIFLIVMCCLKFLGAAGRASNFLVTVRCIPEKDKSAAMGFGMMLICLLTFIPSPIFFGWLLDRVCLVWGKTCTNQGNCWLYDAVVLRTVLSYTAAGFIFIGTLLDIAVWYYAKDLKIFDDEETKVEKTK